MDFVTKVSRSDINAATKDDQPGSYPQDSPHTNGEYVYAPAGSNARMPSLHTLDITELYVNLITSNSIELNFDPEPWSQRTWRGHKVTPDAYIEIGGRKYWHGGDVWITEIVWTD